MSAALSSSSPDAVPTLTPPVTPPPSRFDVRLAIANVIGNLLWIAPFLAGLPRLTGHLGVTGAHLFGDAGSGIHLAMNFHSTREMYRSFRTHISGVQTALRVSR